MNLVGDYPRSPRTGGPVGWVVDNANQHPGAVIFLPVTALAAVGGALSLLGGNWLLFLVVVSIGASIALLLLWTVARSDNARQRVELDELKERTEHHETMLNQQELRIGDLSDAFRRADLAAQMLGMCCYSSTEEQFARLADRVPRHILNTQFGLLAQGVVDVISQILPGVRRIAVYYRSDDVLVWKQQTGWDDAEPPTLSATAVAPGPRMVSPDLFDAMERGLMMHIRDVDRPEHDERSIAAQVPNGNRFKTFACFPMRAFKSFADQEERKCLLVGAVVVQHEKPNAFSTAYGLAMVTLMVSLLAAGLLHVVGSDEN
jgi:hypothetical protein